MKEGHFRVGVTRDLRAGDGSFLFEPAADLGVLDARPEIEWEFLREAGPTVTADLVAGYDALLHLGPPVDADALGQASRLALIARSGVGLDAINMGACNAGGVAVTITPDGVAGPMASATVALVLALAHRLTQRNDAFHRGAWDEGRGGVIGVGLRGRTLGLIGFGRIGRSVKRLLEPFELRVLAYTPRLSDSDASANGVERAELDALVQRSDFVVVACPLTAETRHLLDARRIALMKPTAFLVNIARGPIVDQRALVAALREERIAGAGLDVFEDEPVDPGDEIVGLPNVIAAPHSLGYTDELLRSCIDGACTSIVTIARGEIPPHLANPEVVESAAFRRKLTAIAAKAKAWMRSN